MPPTGPAAAAARAAVGDGHIAVRLLSGSSSGIHIKIMDDSSLHHVSACTSFALLLYQPGRGGGNALAGLQSSTSTSKQCMLVIRVMSCAHHFSVRGGCWADSARSLRILWAGCGCAAHLSTLQDAA